MGLMHGVLVIMVTLVGSGFVFAAQGGATIIPRPAKLVAGQGCFTLNEKTAIVMDGAHGTMLAERLEEMVFPATGWNLTASKGSNAIFIKIDPECPLGEEGYRLDVTPEAVRILAAKEAGAFYGMQTLRQLLPPQIYSTKNVENVAWTIPAVKIEDQPRFKWRGIMLDCARHFFTADEVMRFIDELAIHKLNVFHWHLTDDQGWRIEIKKYPKLTEVGAWRDSIAFDLDPKLSTAYDKNGRYGGYYTQEDIKRVVAYAAARHITIVPEIEMPGHSTAALAAYPQYSCSGVPVAVATQPGVLRAVYCPGNEGTFDFLQGVLEEVTELFPGQFVHIGGDECPKAGWKKCPKCQGKIKAESLEDEVELQSYLVRRIEKYLNSRGKRLIGWDEILEGGLAPNATVMSWRGVKGGITAANKGHDVVMTPTSHCYLDYYQAKSKHEPKAIGGFVPVEKVYSFDPIPGELAGTKARHVLGVQGNLWTEYMPNFRHVEYMAWPRGCAIAEVGWSDPAGKEWTDFRGRLGVHLERLKVAGVNFRKLDKGGKEE